ncbi:photosystem II protein PsbQ [Halomicronema sp. CCY15110]|uniref:photosystem II protein PsbQ n=1 Tax=Halomicronema sp. CCY15110 TaxID=2767773 RepID=UPI00194DDD05|nr:photosystem II protein PsbQ [Halomicronema sp. CCY15110]
MFSKIKWFRLRPILSVVLAVVATCLVGCGGADVAQPTTYSSEQIAQLEIFAPRVTDLRDRFPELEDYIQNKNWVDISAFIHGPMGELRVGLERVAVRLLPQDEKQAKYYAEEIGTHLEKLDAAAEEYNQIEAGKQYREVLDDFNAFVELIPDLSV